MPGFTMSGIAAHDRGGTGRYAFAPSSAQQAPGQMSSTEITAQSGYKEAAFGRWVLPVLVGLMVVGLAVRVWGLTAYDVWFDEAYHVQLVKLPTVGAMLDAILSNPPSDPLYAILLRGWTGLFGTGD